MTNEHTPHTVDEARLQETASVLRSLGKELNNVLFGQEQLVEAVIIALVAQGHVLLEGLPGLGKTELVKGLAAALGLGSKRIQFTPDLLPGDITGNPMLQEVHGERKFVFQQGPVFTNLLLADEINRASPKTQSALLEAMQEKRVTVMGETHTLPDPFFVFATQNPIELEGTYPLPEAQVDRFMFKIEIFRNDIPVVEKIINNREIGISPTVSQVMDRETLVGCAQLSRDIYLPPVVVNYIARLTDATHPGQSEAAQHVKFGASPRAAIGLAAAVRARAALHARGHASVEDVQALAPHVLRHRVILDYQARLEGQTGNTFVEALLKEVPTQAKELPSALQAAKI